MSRRVEQLLSSMTMEEKVGQLNVLADMVHPITTDINPETHLRHAGEMKQLIRKGLVGGLFNGLGREGACELQTIAVEETRLGIPMVFAADVIHGFHTVFPIPLGETASFEPDLARRTARATALEATAHGIHWTFAPAVDIARDQRWGRGAEGTGEDTFVSCLFGAARVQGFQGPDPGRADALAACVKHYAAYGAVQAGLDYNTVDISPQTLQDIHLPPFRAAVAAGVCGVMSSFNDINGVPASANPMLLTEVLREQWKFEGVTVSDYTSDMELIAHGFAEDARDAVLKAFNAGLDLSLQSGLYVEHLPALVASGDVSMERLDQAVRRMLLFKERIGLLDDPYKSLRGETSTAVDRDELDALARDSARRSIVMTRNDGDLLPLGRSGQRIALIGPYAQDVENIEGCWTIYGDKSRYVSLEAGMRAALEDPGSLDVESGCGLEQAIEGGIERAVQLAGEADVVVLALGEPKAYSGEAQSRVEITLPEVQQRLAEAVAATGKPIVVLLWNGRALALHGAVRDANAMLVTWFLGSQTGHAIADVLFGRYSPSGRLPISFPLRSGQQPYFYNTTHTGRPELPDVKEFKTRWREVSHAALFAFGHGLTYGQAVYGPVQLERTTFGRGGTITVSATLRNAGRVAIEEVAQLYIHDRVASRVRPVRELKGFKKIALDPGESVEVRFELDESLLAFSGVDNVVRAEPGLFDVWIAPSSIAGEPAQFRLLAQQDESAAGQA